MSSTELLPIPAGHFADHQKGNQRFMTGFRLLILTALTIAMFAANSVLTRAALSENAIGAGQFSMVRLASGTLMLALLVLVTGQRPKLLSSGRVQATIGLWAYMVGFSIAYIWLDAGVGALILFAVVQATMFTGGLISGEKVPTTRWIGMFIATGGLIFLFLPRIGAAPDLSGAAMMVFGAFGFAIYSLVGKKSTAPLPDTAVNFGFATVLTALIPWGALDPTPYSTYGVLLAVISGAITSGLGYALWYTLMPALGATRAAVAQLSAPALALIGGAIFLAEPITIGAMLAAVLIMVGVGVASMPRAT